jgi:hypothetical protein
MEPCPAILLPRRSWILSPANDVGTIRAWSRQFDTSHSGTVFTADLLTVIAVETIGPCHEGYNS